jgi:MFS transporter, UMF1 family
MKVKLDKSVWGWSLYDWGNSAFSTTIVAAFFPIFFKKYWASNLTANESTFYLGIMMSLSALLFAIVAPILGSFGDIYGYAKKGLIHFSLIGVLSCFLFYFVPGGDWFMALSVYFLSWLGFSGSNLYYDALLVEVSDDENMNWVSCLGYGLGYLGGGILVVVNALMVTKPQLFGLSDSVSGVKWSFMSVGIWWFVFTIPLMLWVPHPKPIPGVHTLGSGFREIYKTLMKVRKDRNLLLFLISFFFYIDGVHTIYKMAVDFALSINLQSDDLIKAIVIVQFVGFPATLVFSYLAKKIGTKNGILFGILIYSLICLLGAFISTATHFYILAIVLGLVQGGVQALSRSFYTTLIPKDSSAEYFGFYNMFGKFSAVLGPFLVGLTSIVSNNSRLSLLSIFILFLVGGCLLIMVDRKKVIN